MFFLYFLLYITIGFLIVFINAFFQKERYSHDDLLGITFMMMAIWPVAIPLIVIEFIWDIRKLPKHENSKKA